MNFWLCTANAIPKGGFFSVNGPFLDLASIVQKLPGLLALYGHCCWKIGQSVH